MKSINPHTGKEFQKFPNLNPLLLNRRIKSGYKAFDKWRRFPFEGRAFKMRELAKLLEARKQKLGKLITKEMGKVYSESISEIEKCAWVCKYYAENAQDFLNDEVVETDGTTSFITYRPLGLVLALMPCFFCC